MRTQAWLHPVGPLPARVYWTRRLLLLALLAVVIAAIAVACSGGNGSGAPRSAPTTTATSTPSSSPAAVGACTRAALTVTASTDATRYPAGAYPQFTVTVRNGGSAPCRFVDSAATRIWSIYSGSDRVWTDAGCNAGAPRITRMLAAHSTLRHRLVWGRHRSGVRCADAATTAAPGTYLLYVTVRGERSAPAVFHLTG